MNPRIKREELEHIILYKNASFADETKGRQIAEEKCELRTDFQRDRDRILHSKAFRRLKHKTQVFISPGKDHFRTRLTHTLEVSQIARTIARALELNEDLIEAMSLGHDLGHTPFGHSGEYILNKLNPKGFKHYEQSIRVVDFLSSRGDKVGLNLTYEVRDGILNHSGSNEASTLEGKILKYADRIAYINHDIDDATSAGIIREEDLPSDLVEILGDSHSKRINTMIRSLVNKSYHKDYIKMEPEIEKATLQLRKFMFENVYLNKVVKSENEKIEHLITTLFNYYKKDISRIPKENLKIYDKIEHTEEDIICDYIAGMTDIFAVKLYEDLFIPVGWSK
ncbi:deoxyguanosinetriphosphate triphosphohydrolase [Peptoniphilus catoniae]|uniref:deoxyguanosinetriphosphate triphosphohydrolase n=1 Tax=Peptoniphilus catoniae TaxID=1660341 RepID=UPI0010FF05F9|nr:deoxyguanosinetriphosphate triphosphohydrolase [Peptoniphilus catoniae]